MSSAKLPFVVVNWISALAVAKPPQPPATKEEQIETGKVTDNNAASAIRVNSSLAFSTVTMLIEVATILAVSNPTHPLSRHVLSILTFKGGQPGNIRINSISANGVAFMTLGAIIRQWSFRALGSFFRYQVSIQKDHQLITTGPYSIVRHPAYTGVLFAVSGWFLYAYAPGSWYRESGFINTLGGKAFMVAYSIFGALGAAAQTLGRMSDEDRILKQKFGKNWDEWAKRVPYMVIPGIW